MTLDDSREQVRQASDIADVLGGYLPLTRQGRIYVALCPWHNDSRPSLQVNPERQSWRCWVCGIGGDVFSFVMRREGIDFREALELLADRANISLSKAAPVQPGSPNDKRTLFAATAWAERLFQKYLAHSPDADAARRYFHDRGISQDSVNRFHLGYAPDQWQWLVDQARSTEFSAAVLEKTGLIGRSSTSGKPYDRFKGRVIFPIHDVQGRTIGFGGRILPGNNDPKAAKYVNSPETKLFSKSDNLYALDLARDAIVESRSAIVVEGYTDVIALQQAGVRNVIAVLGTALGQRHIHLLRRYADRIYLLLDGDEAGQRRTNDILELFVSEQADLRIVTLPDQLDPCDFVQQRGVDAFHAALDTAVDALEHKLRITTAGVDVRRDLHKANEALESLLSTMARAPRLQDGAGSEVRLREHQFLSRLARKFEVDEQELRKRLSSLRRATNAAPDRSAAPSDEDVKVRAAELDPYDRNLLEVLACQPDLTLLAADEVGVDEMSSEPARRLYQTFITACQDGSPVEFNQLLSGIESESLKGLLVELDEQAAAKNITDPETLLKSFIADYQRRFEEREHRNNVAALDDKTMHGQDEMDLLQQMIERQRSRQGIVSPTDG
ncbi:DNA primase [Blastopirellula sp. JC732]|uniref:DNA primase n=1 Tax=Blastopirellula sediminis TaxID=2894196 RepID=A0A9X1MIX6_9BACT|nr:DNA primase [Blastopirellula sediminis]MCC9608192.1 DNA primase [Blastopirellula sediminis]MCC9627015.1 DNA primase [Blastopirellula sediminis]